MDGNLRVWDLERKTEVLRAQVSPQESDSRLRNSINLNQLLPMSADRSVTHVPGLDRGLTALAVAADGARALVGDNSGEVFLVDIQTGRVTEQLGRLDGPALSLGWGNGDKFFWTVSGKLTVNRWTVDRRVPPPHRPRVKFVQ